MSMLRPRKMPPFFKLTLVVLCAYILWTFNHPDPYTDVNNANLGVRHTRDYLYPPMYAPNGRPIAYPGQVAQKAVAAAPQPRKDISGTFPVCEGPFTNVAFLKTHKTGSSTMSNIMLRFADTHNLTVGLPLEGKWELGGYPAYIDKQLIDPQLEHYNVLGHHFRFSKDKLDQFMDPATKYVTIIRSPVDNVESVFGFFQDQMPFEEWLNDVNVTDRLKTFYAEPTKYFNRNTDWYFRSKNHMFFDIGYDVNRAEDDEYVNQAIQTMDNQFAFILLTDFFDESLILMKHILCWDWDDIVYIKFKMRIEEAKAEVNPELSDRILKWNHADHQLYDYFNTTFWQKVELFGREKMDLELEAFREEQKKAENECIESYQPFKKKPWILGAKLRPHPSDKCKHLAWSETVYGEFLRDKMYNSIPGLAKQTDDQKAASLALFEQIAGGALQSS